MQSYGNNVFLLFFKGNGQPLKLEWTILDIDLGSSLKNLLRPSFPSFTDQ